MSRALKTSIALVVVVGSIGASMAIWNSTPTEPPHVVAQPNPAQSQPISPRSEVVETNTKPLDDVKIDTNFSTWANSVKAELIRRDDAESLIVAALMTLSNQTTDQLSIEERMRQQVELLTKASTRTSAPAVQWIASLACMQIVERRYPCDVDSFTRALRAADPRNALTQVAPIERARRENDSRGEADSLGAVETSDGFNSYFAAVQPLLFGTVESVRIAQPPSRDSERGLSAVETLSINMLSWLPLPNLKPLVDACGRKYNDPLAVRCVAIAKKLRVGDSNFIRHIGLTIAERLTPFGSVQYGEIGAERRRLDWMQDQVSKTPISPEAMRRLLPTAGGEIEMWQAWLRENNLPATPPADWEGK